MASILPAFATLVAPGALQVPSGTLEIDWANSLTNGLIGCWVPAVMGGVDITDQSPTLIGSTKTNLSGMTLDGAGMTSNSTTGNEAISATATAPYKFGSNGFSILWRGMITAQITNASNPIITGITYDNAQGAPFFICALGPGSGGQYPNISLYWNTAGVLTHFETSVVSSFNVMYTLGATFLPNSNSLLYNAGVQVGSNVFGSSNPNVTATSLIEIGGDAAANTNRTSNCITNICAFWNRVLSAAEMATLNADPYTFVIPAEFDMQLASTPPPVFILMPQIIT